MAGEAEAVGDAAHGIKDYPDVLIPEKGCGSDQAGELMALIGGPAAQGTSSPFPLDLPRGSQ